MSAKQQLLDFNNKIDEVKEKLTSSEYEDMTKELSKIANSMDTEINHPLDLERFIINGIINKFTSLCICERQELIRCPDLCLHPFIQRMFNKIEGFSVIAILRPPPDIFLDITVSAELILICLSEIDFTCRNIKKKNACKLWKAYIERFVGYDIFKTNTNTERYSIDNILNYYAYILFYRKQALVRLSLIHINSELIERELAVQSTPQPPQASPQEHTVDFPERN